MVLRFLGQVERRIEWFLGYYAVMKFKKKKEKKGLVCVENMESEVIWG